MLEGKHYIINSGILENIQERVNSMVGYEDLNDEDENLSFEEQTIDNLMKKG